MTLNAAMISMIDAVMTAPSAMTRVDQLSEMGMHGCTVTPPFCAGFGTVT